MSAPAPFPDRAAILAFVARVQGQGHGKVGKREIAKAFNISGDDRIELKRLLRQLESEGVLSRRPMPQPSQGALPAVVVADILSRDRDGELIAVPSQWDAAEGPAPQILLTFPRKPKQGDPPPGIGARVLLRVERLEREHKGPSWQGHVIKVLPKARTTTLAVFRADPQSGGGRLLPVEKKGQPRELDVSQANRGDAQDGDLVAIEMLSEGRFGAQSARVRERLGSMASEKALSLIAIAMHNIRNVFQPDVLAEADHARPAAMAGREDWRELSLITIDPADAKDHDDAVHAIADASPGNAGGYILTVAIADVAHYVRPRSAMDREALERGNSVYFPDRVVPMLPERISNDLCSLRAGQDRPALAVRMVLAADGRKLSHSFHRIMMRSAVKLSYQQAQAAQDGAPDAATSPLLEPVLRPLYAAYAAIKIARAKRGPLDLDLPERKLLLKADGTLDRVITPPRLDAHRLIEECMILANVAAAETLEEHRQTLIYRVHDEPSLEKLNALAEFLATLGIKLAKGQVLRPAQFNSFLAQVRGTANEVLVNEVVLRSQAQAEYAPENYGHFGLNLARYAHFTSPIRRYADLIVHRALIRALKLGPDGLPDMSPAEMKDVGTKISGAERRAMLAERDTNDRLIATFLSQQIGAQFQGRISGVTRAGLFIKLQDTGADGFVPAATLGSDFFRLDDALHALIGNRTGETFRLGDQVEVKLVEAAPFAGALRFEMLSEGTSGGIKKAFGLKKTFKSAKRDNKPASKRRLRRSP